jgi:hypothetical protein
MYMGARAGVGSWGHARDSAGCEDEDVSAVRLPKPVADRFRKNIIARLDRWFHSLCRNSVGVETSRKQREHEKPKDHTRQQQHRYSQVSHFSATFR